TVTLEPALTVFVFELQLSWLGESTGAVIGAMTCATIGSSDPMSPPVLELFAAAAMPPSPQSPASWAPAVPVNPRGTAATAVTAIAAPTIRSFVKVLSLPSRADSSNHHGRRSAPF